MYQDFKFAFRQLLKSLGFTGIAVLTLALAIGVNAAIFALINGVVLRPVVPLRPEEVVNVFTARQAANRDYRQFSYDEYRAVREAGTDVFADDAALQFSLAGIGADQNMRRSFVFCTSENFFLLMGSNPPSAVSIQRRNAGRTQMFQWWSRVTDFGNAWEAARTLSGAACA